MENSWGDPAFSIVFHRVLEKRKENEKHRPQDLERSRERAVNSLKKTRRIVSLQLTPFVLVVRKTSRPR